MANCAECAARSYCVHTWGRFWESRSNGGTGCAAPMTAPDGWETKAAAFRARRDAEERVAKTRVKVRGDGGQFMWTVHFKAQEWLGGRDSWETEAVTADDAVNNVRWRLFGKTPAAALPHMEAVVQTRELNALEKMRLLDKLMEGERWWTNRKTDSAALLGSRVRRAR